MNTWRRRAQADFNEEIRSHIELEAERLRAEGMSEGESLLEARRRFGNQVHAQERYHDSRRLAWLAAFAHAA